MTSPQPVIKLNPDSPAAREEATIAKLREHQEVFNALHALIRQRREVRRMQLEQASGESAISLRGRCLELTTILLEYFGEGKAER